MQTIEALNKEQMQEIETLKKRVQELESELASERKSAPVVKAVIPAQQDKNQATKNPNGVNSFGSSLLSCGHGATKMLKGAFRMVTQQVEALKSEFQSQKSVSKDPIVG